MSIAETERLILREMAPEDLPALHFSGCRKNFIKALDWS
jgi:hypothetical protein